MTKKNRQSLNGQQQHPRVETAPKTQRAMPSQAWFKCPCDGENNDCLHCNGSGQTTSQLQMRSSRTLSLDHPSSEPYLTKREKNFDLQVNRGLSHLQETFLQSRGESPAVFVNFLILLIATIEKDPFVRGVLLAPLEAGELRSFAQALQSFRANETVRIISRATDAAIAAYERAVLAKRQAAVQRRPISPAAKSIDPKLIQCTICGKHIYDQHQHNKLFHPNLRKRQGGVASTQVVARACQQNQSNKLPPHQLKQSQISAKSPGSKTGQPPQSHYNTSMQHELARSSAAEQAMDAHRTWGGRFRDTNGTFGSYPLHDRMDDESDAG